MVVSAGNTTPDESPSPLANTVAYPGSIGSVLTIGAAKVNADGSDVSVLPTSGRGKELDFVAPGYAVPTLASGGGVIGMTGTSPAAAVAAGLVALVLAQHNAGNFELGDRYHRAIPDCETLKVLLSENHCQLQPRDMQSTFERGGGLIAPLGRLPAQLEPVAVPTATVPDASAGATGDAAVLVGDVTPRALSRARWHASSALYVKLTDGGLFRLTSGFASKADAAAAVATALQACYTAVDLEPLKDLVSLLDEQAPAWNAAATRFRWAVALSVGDVKHTVFSVGSGVFESSTATLTKRFRGAVPHRIATVLAEDE